MIIKGTRGSFAWFGYLSDALVGLCSIVQLFYFSLLVAGCDFWYFEKGRKRCGRLGDWQTAGANIFECYATRRQADRGAWWAVTSVIMWNHEMEKMDRSTVSFLSGWFRLNYCCCCSRPASFIIVYRYFTIDTFFLVDCTVMNWFVVTCAIGAGFSFPCII